MLSVDPSKMQMCSFEYLVYFNVDGYKFNVDTRLTDDEWFGSFI